MNDFKTIPIGSGKRDCVRSLSHTTGNAVFRIELLYLPPYSPNLNLIERLWRFVKKQVLYSKHYDRFDAFRNSINTCITELGTRYKNEMRSLMTLKFQLF